MNPWSTATPDWQERILAGRTLIPDLPLFETEAERALRVFQRLRVPDIVGTPSYGDVCGAWVFALVRAIFGAYDPATRRRMIREFFLLIPKKNGKSSIAAAIMVTAAIVNRRPAAELLLIAPTKKIADIAYKQAAGIIKLDPELMKLFHPQTHQRTITHRLTDAQLLIKAADADVITGSKATFILIDETHVFAQKPSAAEVFVEIRGSLAARPDGFLLQITTQSKTPPAGVFKSELAIARDVRDGKLALPLLPVLYELPLEISKEGGWKDERTWPLVNPNLDRSVDKAYLRDELTKAEREGIEQLMLIASQHFNVEVGLALHGDRWAGAEHWQSAADEELTLDALIARCDVAVVSIDGGGLDDLLGLAVIGRDRVTREWLLWAKAWCQRDVLERRKEIAPRLADFAEAGELTICNDDPTQDLREVADICERLRDEGLLPEKAAIGLDPAGVAAIIDELASRGIGGDQVVAVPQGWRLSGAVKGMERKLKDGTLWHSGAGLMAWCVGNAKAEPRGNATVIEKAAAGKAKIDPLVAAFGAVTLMSRNPEPRKSVYEARGVLVV